MEAFIQNMHNKTVKERLRTEPKNRPQDAFSFAVAFEEGISQQNSFAGGNEIKNESIYATDNRVKYPCTWCGPEISQNQLTVCKAKNKNCRNCGIISHILRACIRLKIAILIENARSSEGGRSRRINLTGQAADNSEEKTDWDEDNVLLRLETELEHQFLFWKDEETNNRLLQWLTRGRKSRKLQEKMWKKFSKLT